MTRAFEVAMLKRMVEARDAQCEAAQSSAGRAALDLADRERDRAEQLSELEDQVALWAERTSAVTMDIFMTRMLSAAIADSESTLRHREAAVQSARRVLEARKTVWRMALGRTEAASDLLDHAVRRLQQKREEARLNDLGDRAAFRSAAL